MTNILDLLKYLDPSLVTMEELLTEVKPPRNRDEEKWIVFHKTNPMVFRLFSKYAYERIATGFHNYSARGIIHKIRWETAMPYLDENPATGEVLKIGNGNSSSYSRLWMELNPEYDGFFRKKRVKVTNAAYRSWPNNSEEAA